MIPFEKDRQQQIPTSSLKVIGLGGAGANMIDRAALDGMDGAELLALNTDMRTLSRSMASEKIQLGLNLTKGLGAGGDPELGKQAVLESEAELRNSLRGRKIVFLCVGLGGGTGSGAAPIVTRLAREEGAFVVVFATMPFGFEGQRRREQAETALNELAVLSNALVTFDNGRMGELVLAKQGIHEAFSAADRMISESIKAVTRLVLKPGLVNVGLDDLVTALKTTRSRCLFGSGIAKGENRAQAALKNALSSPLLDRGSLLNDAESVLVHVGGGADMTLYEVELLMQGLTKHVPASAHILFGAAIDEGMGEQLSVTIISALPENKLGSATQSTQSSQESPFQVDEPEHEPNPPAQAPPREETKPVFRKVAATKPEAVVAPIPAQQLVPKVEVQSAPVEEKPQVEEKKPSPRKEEPTVFDVVEKPESVPKKEESQGDVRGEDFAGVFEEVAPPEEKAEREDENEGEAETVFQEVEEEEVVFQEIEAPEPEEEEVISEDPFAELKEPGKTEEEPAVVLKEEDQYLEDDEPEMEAVKSRAAEPEPVAPEEEELGPIESKVKGTEEKEGDPEEVTELKDSDWTAVHKPSVRMRVPGYQKKSGVAGQGELELDGGPKGRFEGENPNLVDGEDLDVPPYLRKRAR